MSQEKPTSGKRCPIGCGIFCTVLDGDDVTLENPEAEIVEPEVSEVPVNTEKRRRPRKTTDEILRSPIKRYESK